jgi:hypothetical protein
MPIRAAGIGMVLRRVAHRAAYAQHYSRSCLALFRVDRRVYRLRPNRRLQLTAFGARDRAFFEATLGTRLGGS